MQQDLLFFLVIAVLLSVGGVTLLVLGLRGVRRDRAMREQERTHTEGRIAEVNKHPGTRYRRGNTWHPVVEYTADGKTLKEESTLGYPLDNFEVGSRWTSPMTRSIRSTSTWKSCWTGTRKRTG